MMSTFQSSLLLLVEEANSTARAEEMDVLPTPPLPPTKITGVLWLLLLLPFFLLAAIIDAISSTNGCNECSRVDEYEYDNDGDDENEDCPTTPPLALAAIPRRRHHRDCVE